MFGHIISNWGTEVDKARIEVVEKLPSPSSTKGVMNFLGHVGFY